MHVVFVLELATEIVFALNRVTGCIPAVFVACCRTSVSRPGLVDILDMATKVFGPFECWRIAAKITLIRLSGDG
jgi:hypothetical protein